MLKNTIMSVAAVVLTVGLSAPANAAVPMAPKASTISAENASVIEVGQRCRRCDRGGRRNYRRGRDRSNFSLSFSFGSPGYYAPRYYAPRYRAPRVYYSAPAAWTPGWYTYCKTKYRSFNPHTGRFMTYSGHWQLCR